MDNAILMAGRAAGILGILVCIVAVIARATGHHYLGGLESATLLNAGTSAVVAGCFLLLLKNS